jgi:4,5-DOPA dioxygenase extradiol
MRMPVVFIGHGSPMNALADNVFTRRLGALGRRLPKPRAILCVSAHWVTAGTFITRMAKPKTIHDFYGFPPDLFAVQYPAPGSVEIADLIRSTVADPLIQPDEQDWGLDHGAWSILRHMYPEADIPVLQLSIDGTRHDEHHFDLGRRLMPLRDQGILILGSGNIVHNLNLINWDAGAPPYPWAVQFDNWVAACLEKREFKPLYDDILSSEAARLSIPTPEHYRPLLYVLGAVDGDDTLRVEHEGIEHGSISMRCISFG